MAVVLVSIGLLLVGTRPGVAPCHCGCHAPSHALCSSPVCRCGCQGPWAYLASR
jgi:hypothetical protein